MTCMGADVQFSCRLLVFSIIMIPHNGTTVSFWWEFYRCQTLGCHLLMTITSCCSILMHSPCCKNLKTSQFTHGQLNHWTFRPVTMIGIHDFAQLFQKGRITLHRPQSTTSSTLCKVHVLHYMRQTVFTPNTGWFLDPPGRGENWTLDYTCFTSIFLSITFSFVKAQETLLQFSIPFAELVAHWAWAFYCISRYFNWKLWLL